MKKLIAIFLMCAPICMAQTPLCFFRQEFAAKQINSSIAVTDYTNNLAGWWTFDDAGLGSATDTISAINGSLTDCLATNGTKNIAQTAYNFNGSSSLISLGTGYTNYYTQPTGTISVWVYPLKYAGNCLFCMGCTGDGFVTLYYSAGTTGKFLAMIRNEAVTLVFAESANTYAASNWYHVAYTVSSGGNKMYVNGVDANLGYTAGSASSTQFFDDLNNVGYMTFGVRQYQAANSLYTSGTIDDMRIYKMSLSAEQIANIYNAGKP